MIYIYRHIIYMCTYTYNHICLSIYLSIYLSINRPDWYMIYRHIIYMCIYIYTYIYTYNHIYQSIYQSIYWYLILYGTSWYLGTSRFLNHGIIPVSHLTILWIPTIRVTDELHVILPTLRFVIFYWIVFLLCDFLKHHVQRHIIYTIYHKS